MPAIRCKNLPYRIGFTCPCLTTHSEVSVGVHEQPVEERLELRGRGGLEVRAYAGSVAFRATASPNEVIRQLPPFGPTTLVAGGAGLIVVADNAEYALRVYDTDGSLKSIFREAPARMARRRFSCGFMAPPE